MKQLMVSVIALSLLLGRSLGSRAESDQQPADLAPVVSIVKLLSVPERYNGMTVLTAGYARIGSEHKALYLSESDAAHMVVANSIRLSLDAYNGDAVKLDQRYVEVQGVFEQASTDAPGWRYYGGSIRVGTIEELPTPPEKR